MSLDEELTNFLSLERTLEELSERLARLRSETESYSTARDALEIVAQELRRQLDSITAVVSGVGTLVDGLRSVDAAALNAAQRELVRLTEDLAKQVKTLGQQQAEGNNKLSGAIGAAKQELTSSVAGLASNTDAGLDEIRNQVKGLRSAMLSGFIGLAALCTATTVVCLLR